MKKTREEKGRGFGGGAGYFSGLPGETGWVGIYVGEPTSAIQVAGPIWISITVFR